MSWFHSGRVPARDPASAGPCMDASGAAATEHCLRLNIETPSQAE